MVFVWGIGWGNRRRRRGGSGYGRGHGPPPPGFGYRYHRRNDSCLRDLLFLNTGCCLANALGCSGLHSLLLVPTTVRTVWRAGTGTGRRPVDRLIAAVGVYQREISPRRAPCCPFTPTCSAYAVQALDRHGAGRGSWLSVRRLVRCRPGATGGADPVPVAA